MDAWGILILVVSLVLYFFSKKNGFFLFTAGVGAGIIVGAVWAMVIVRQVLSGY